MQTNFQAPVIPWISDVLPGARSRAVHAKIAAVREQADQLQGSSPEQLRGQCKQLRHEFANETPDAKPLQIRAFAVIYEGLRRVLGVSLYDVQLRAAIALADGCIAEMQTGEGKTFSCSPAAFLHALTGRGVHVATTNQYLAQRDFEIIQPVYQFLGISVGMLPEQSGSTAEKQAAYRCDITYGTGYEFGFDYLRDQLTLQNAASRPLGAELLNSLRGEASVDEQMVQRGLYFSIVDEADQVLIDDAASPLILSGGAQGEAPDAEVHLAARDLIDRLVQGEHYHASGGAGGCTLTDAGIELIHSQDDQIPIAKLQRTWTEYVEQALHAQSHRRDVHYVISDEKEIQIVDAGTGRIFSDRTWRAGLHQAVEAKEGVPITPDRSALAQITRQRFSRMYERLAGMTGTAAGCEREFREVYDLSIVPIPLRTPSKRQQWKTRFFVDDARKWDAIVDSVEEIARSDRPILIGTNSIADSLYLAELMQERSLDFQLLNGRQDADEASVVATAGHQGALIIATSLAGRGTDIKLGAGVRELGGIHVIVCECSGSSRVDRQLVGRCGRQGDPGSTQTFVSAEDALIQQNGSWLVQAIIRHSDSQGESKVDLSAQLRRIQRSCERKGYAARSSMLRRDLSRDSLFSNQTLDS